MRFSYKGALVLGFILLIGVFVMPKFVFAGSAWDQGFNVMTFNYDNPSNPSTLYVTTTATGGENSQAGECTTDNDSEQQEIEEAQLLTVAYIYVTNRDDSNNFNQGDAINGLSGSTTPELTQVGQNGCTSFHDQIKWEYTINTHDSPGTFNISSLQPNTTYYFCLKTISEVGSTFSRCDSFSFTRPTAPGSFSVTSASVTNQPNYCQVNIYWSSASNATSYTVLVRFWSSGVWGDGARSYSPPPNEANYMAHNLTGTSYSYQERKGVDLYYEVVAVNSSGYTYSSNYQFAGDCSTPSVSITSSPSSIAYGGSSTIYWTPSNAYLCSASGGSSGWAGTRSSSSGQQSWGTGALYNPPTSYTYSIYCSDSDGGYASPTVSTTVSIAPPPTPTVSISASPTSVAWNNSGSTLTWSTTNSTSCSASGDWSGSKATSGNQSTGALPTVKTYTFTLTCSGIGGSANKSAQVVVNPPTPTLSGVTTNASSINYCSAGPSGTTVSWTYSDPASSPQAYYEVQVTNNGGFTSPMYDSGKVNSSSTTASLQNASLQFNTTYKARVMVWDSLTGSSAWYETGSWTTPPNAYPQVAFTWTPTSPQASASVPFTDATTFSDSGSGHSWSWTFGDGGTSTSQNPSHAFTTDNTYTITLSATDNQSQSCSLSKTINVQKPIPQIKEVAP